MKKLLIWVLCFLWFVSSWFAASTTVDLWYGVSLEQSSSQTKVVYKKKVLKTYSHKSKATNPFVYDEWCNILTQKLDELQKKTNMSLSADQKNKVWNSFSKSQKDDCMKEHYRTHIEVSTIPSSKKWLLIHKYFYEWAEEYLLDKTTSRLYAFDMSIISVQDGKNGIFVWVGRWRGYDDLYAKIYIINTQWKSVLQYSTAGDLKGFELLANWKIKILLQNEVGSTIKEIIVAIKQI